MDSGLGQRLRNEALWQQYVEGDQNAFGELYSRYHKSLTAYCYGRLRSRELAENAASETLIKLLHHPRPSEIQSFESWIFTVARNECNTYWSTEERRKELINENLTVSTEQNPEVEDRLALENIDQVIQENLDEVDYRIWQLYHQGYDNTEVAGIMNLNEKTVANRKSMARTKLRTLLKNYDVGKK